MVFDHVTVKAPSEHALLLATPAKSSQARVGFIISKKNVKHAVARNRIKRLTREYFRHHQTDLPELDVIFMARKGIDNLSNPELSKLIAKLFRKLTKRAQQK